MAHTSPVYLRREPGVARRILTSAATGGLAGLIIAQTLDWSTATASGGPSCSGTSVCSGSSSAAGLGLVFALVLVIAVCWVGIAMSRLWPLKVFVPIGFAVLAAVTGEFLDHVHDGSLPVLKFAAVSALSFALLAVLAEVRVRPYPRHRRSLL